MAKLPQVSAFKYLGTMLDQEGGCRTEVAKEDREGMVQMERVSGCALLQGNSHQTQGLAI